MTLAILSQSRRSNPFSNYQIHILISAGNLLPGNAYYFSFPDRIPFQVLKRMDKSQKINAPSATTIDGPEGSQVLVFSEATTQEQQVKCFKVVGSSFGWPLPEADYIEREKYLTGLPLTRTGGAGVRWWCLRTEDWGHVVATCKILNRDLLTRTADGVTRDRQGYCIGAVATDKRYRRLGLAEFLLRAVAQWMDGPGEADASMLYSSIGKVWKKRKGCYSYFSDVSK